MDTTIVVVILGLVAGTAAGVFVVWRGWKSKEDDSIYHFRCPQCQRRLRYMAKQVGHKGKCNHCSREVLFPPTSQSID